MVDTTVNMANYMLRVNSKICDHVCWR